MLKSDENSYLEKGTRFPKPETVKTVGPTVKAWAWAVMSIIQCSDGMMPSPAQHTEHVMLTFP